MTSKLLAVVSLTALATWWAPVSANADSLGLSINGTCEAGVCTSLTPLAAGSSASLPFNIDVTLNNGDVFGLAGTITASSSGGGLLTTQLFYAQYLGNNGLNVASQTDALSVLAISQMDTTPQSTTVSESFTGSFSPGVVSGSVSLQLTASDGANIFLGPFSTSSFSGSGSAPETLASITTWDEQFNLTFGAGSSVGSCIDINISTSCPSVSAVPGPIAGAGLPGLMMTGAGLFGLWRRKRKAAVEA